MTYIYRVVSPSEKSYIGFTTNTPLFRWKTHLRNAARGVKNKLYDAIRKYGSETFTLEILYSSSDVKNTLQEMEPYFIKKFDSIVFGYNLAPGGEGNTGPRSATSNKKRSITMQARRKNNPELFSKNTGHTKKAMLWSIKFPDGHCQVISNLRKFCRDNNLQQGNLWRTSTGVYKKSQGFSCERIGV